MSVKESPQTAPVDANGTNGPAAKPVHAFVQLRAMYNVPENWDGYNADAPEPKAIEAAVAFLHALAHYQIGCQILPFTIVSPTRNGGILLEWEHGPHGLEVEIESEADVEAAYLNTETHEGEVVALNLKSSEARRFFELASRIAPALHPEPHRV